MFEPLQRAILILSGSEKGMSGRWHVALLVAILVMSFGLTSALIIFKSLVSDIHRDMLNVFGICLSVRHL